jgi:tetratricopeptide (TPR) repeat protein
MDAGNQELVQHILERLSIGTTRDQLAIGLSILALLLSTISPATAVFSYFQKRSEAQYSLRKQLTDTLSKLLDLALDFERFVEWDSQRSRADMIGVSNSPTSKIEYPQSYRRMIADQRRFLVRQSEHLAKQIPNLVSPYEYMIIADNFNRIDNYAKANEYYARAIKGHDDPLEKGIALRQYGRFLFGRKDINTGRSKYKEALECGNGDTDAIHGYRGDTYERWAGAEGENDNHIAAISLYQEALGEYQRIKNEFYREQQLQRVRERLDHGRTLKDLPDHAGSEASIDKAVEAAQPLPR